jgi:hypothetical protein
MIEITISGISLMVIVGILVAVIKAVGSPSRLLPLFSVLIGMIFGVLAYFADGITLWQGIVGGILTGAATSGIYDFSKKTILGK